MLRSYHMLLIGVLILFLVCTTSTAFGKETSESTKSEKKAKDTTHTLQDSRENQKGGVPETQAKNETPKEARVKGRIVQTKPNKCPDCGSIRIARIMYGLPDFSDEELKKAVQEGRVVLGGCIITPDSPEWKCKACGVAIDVKQTKHRPTPRTLR